MEEFEAIQDFGLDDFLMQHHQEGCTQLTLEENRREYERDPAHQRDDPRMGGEAERRNGGGWQEVGGKPHLLGIDMSFP